MSCAFDQVKRSLAATSSCAGNEAGVGLQRRCGTAGASGMVWHGSRKRGASYPAPVLAGVPEEVASLCGTPERGVNALGDLFGPKEKDKHC